MKSTDQISLSIDFYDSITCRDYEDFRNHKRKARDIFSIHEISERSAYEFVRKYHYLGDAQFFCIKAFGLFYDRTTELVGCATFSLPQGNSSLDGWFGLGNDIKNIFELSRLCMLPDLNNTNATSYLLGGAIKILKKDNNNIRERLHKEGKEMNPEDFVCRAIITLACAERHVGSIYQVCNFKYYGIANEKCDFYRIDGKKNPRGKVSQWHGVWIAREREYRYAYILDKSLTCLYKEESRPSQGAIITTECCGGRKYVYDNRYGEYFTCPKCTGHLKKIDLFCDNENQTIIPIRHL